jgi:hypothetical protein
MTVRACEGEIRSILNVSEGQAIVRVKIKVKFYQCQI